MRRHLLTLALTGFFGAVALSSDASACHKKKCAPATCVVEAPPCPPPPPAPVCEPAPKHCKKKFQFKLFSCFHKKSACPAPAPVACPAPVVQYAPVVVPSAQVIPSGQFIAPSGQGS